MSEQDDGGPAFPGAPFPHAPGMTLRDWFAGQALAGMTACPSMRDDLTEQDYATISYKMADAMLRARKP